MISHGVDFCHKSPASGHLFFSSSDTLVFPVTSQNVTNLSYLTVHTLPVYSKFINVFECLWSARFLLWCPFQHCVKPPKHRKEY